MMVHVFSKFRRVGEIWWDYVELLNRRSDSAQMHRKNSSKIKEIISDE